MSHWQKQDEKVVTQHHTVIHKMNAGWFQTTDFVREFNFAARQVTTVTESVFANTSKSVMTIAQQQSVQNFNDIEGKEAIIEAHGHLVRLKGTPEPLSDYVGEGLGKTTVPVTGLK